MNDAILIPNPCFSCLKSVIRICHECCRPYTRSAIATSRFAGDSNYAQGRKTFETRGSSIMHHLFLALSLTSMFIVPCLVFVDPQIEEQKFAPAQKAPMSHFHFTL
jgi:hypothetical protein